MGRQHLDDLGPRLHRAEGGDRQGRLRWRSRQLAGALGLGDDQGASRVWVGSNAKLFRGHAVASNSHARQFQVNEHKMLPDGSYEKCERGNVRILGRVVIDPWPGVGIWLLTAGEMKSTYVAAVQVMGEGQRMAALDRALTSR